MFYIYIYRNHVGTKEQFLSCEWQTKACSVKNRQKKQQSVEYRNDLTVIVTSAVVRSEELSGFIRPRYCAKSMATSGGTHL